MLSPDCLGFRESFSPSFPEDTTPEMAAHRSACPACGAWAAAMERAARPLPLPERLRTRLRSIPQMEEDEAGGEILPFRGLRISQVPMPDRLAERLRAVPAVSRRPELPFWLRSSRAAIAASYLLAAITVPAMTALGVGSLSARAADTVTRIVRSTVAQAGAVGAEGRERLDKRLTSLETRFREEVGTTREELESSLTGLVRISRSWMPAPDSNHPGGRDTAPSSRRPR
jgi:hypothetical protein